MGSYILPKDHIGLERSLGSTFDSFSLSLCQATSLPVYLFSLSERETQRLRWTWRTPGLHGYRMLAEWETHSKCWMGWFVSTSPLSHEMIMLFRFMGHEINDFFSRCFGNGFSSRFVLCTKSN